MTKQEKNSCQWLSEFHNVVLWKPGGNTETIKKKLRFGKVTGKLPRMCLRQL